MWFHAKSHLYIWRKMIWPGAIVSFVPRLSLHLLNRREQRCFTGCLTNQLTAMLCCKGPGSLSTIFCKAGIPPKKHTQRKHVQRKNNLQEFFSYRYTEQFFEPRLKTKTKSNRSLRGPYYI